MSINNNSFSSSGNLFIKNQTFEKFKTSGKCNLEDVTCTGPFVCSGQAQIKNSRLNTIQASGNVDMRNSTADKINASGRFYALNCLKIGTIKASGHLDLVNCEGISKIIASGSLSLFNTKINGDVVYSGKNLQVNDSTITGKLECRDKKITINNSLVNEIFVKQSSSSSYTSLELFGIFKFKFTKQSHHSSEHVIELIGKNCIVNTITFEEGCTGRIVLKDGAQVLRKDLRRL